MLNVVRVPASVGQRSVMRRYASRLYCVSDSDETTLLVQLGHWTPRPVTVTSWKVLLDWSEKAVSAIGYTLHSIVFAEAGNRIIWGPQPFA